MTIVVRRRTKRMSWLDIIHSLYPILYRERIMQAHVAAAWVRREFEQRLGWRKTDLGIRLDWFEHEVGQIFAAELKAGQGYCGVENPPAKSPVDMYRLALQRAGIEVTKTISEALPPDELRIVPAWVKVYGNRAAPPALLYSRYAMS